MCLVFWMVYFVFEKVYLLISKGQSIRGAGVAYHGILRCQDALLLRYFGCTLDGIIGICDGVFGI